MIILLFCDDVYFWICEVEVVGVNECGGILFDWIIFYVIGGGQFGDIGCFEFDDGIWIEIVIVVYDMDKFMIVFVLVDGQNLLQIGIKVIVSIDWVCCY